MPLPRSRIGIVSDTHGLLRPEVSAWLMGCDRIIHGGDIGGPAILGELARIAPLTAVRGNNDDGPWAESLREIEIVEAGGVRIVVIHSLTDLRIDLEAERVRVVVSGHSHKPQITERDGVIFLNPGSAGPRRFKLPVALGEIWIEGASAHATIVQLNC